MGIYNLFTKTNVRTIEKFGALRKKFNLGHSEKTKFSADLIWQFLAFRTFLTEMKLTQQ